jgi:type I restriction enzyme S subunit
MKSKKVWRESDTNYRPISTVLDSIIDRRGLTATKIGGKWENRDGIPVISANNIKHGLFVEMNSAKRINAELFEKWMPIKLKRGDVLLVSEGATFGELLYLGESLKAALGQRLFAIRCNNDYDSRYLYYYLKSKKGQQELRTRTTGTSVLGIRQSELRQIVIPDIRIEEQREIADILGSIDDKILLNRQMNTILEAMSGAIFKRWFVDFEFPNEESKPYKSSGGRMLHNEMLAKDIPADWHVDKLGNYARIKGRIGWKGLQVSEYITEGPYIIGGQEFENGHVNWDKCSHVSEERYKESPEIMLKEKDILMTKDGTIGKLAYVEKLKERATVASHIHVIRSDSTKITQLYLLNYFKSSTFRRMVEGKISGSVVPALLQSDMANMPIVLPTADVVQKFELIAHAIQSKIDLNSESAFVLEKVRETLLPLVISGKIRVPVH